MIRSVGYASCLYRVAVLEAAVSLFVILVWRLPSKVLLLTGDGLRFKVILKLLMARSPSPLSSARVSTWWSGMFVAGLACGRFCKGSKAEIACAVGMKKLARKSQRHHRMLLQVEAADYRLITICLKSEPSSS